MGLSDVYLHPEPEPKASCPSCHRPVALLKSGTCLYCGAPIPGAVHIVEPQQSAPPDLQLTSGSKGRTAGSGRWIRGMIAFGVAALGVAALMGPCMRS